MNCKTENQNLIVRNNITNLINEFPEWLKITCTFKLSTYHVMTNK